MNKHNNYYTEEDKRIVRKYAGKKSAEEIGLMINRTPASVRHFAYLNKISLRKSGQYHHQSKLTDLQVEMVKALSKCGFSETEINKSCFRHVTRSCITNIVRGATRYAR